MIKSHLPLHITAVATVQSNTVTPDLRMVKAAILYADHTTLCSGHTSLIMLFAGLPFLSFQQKLQAVKELIPVFMKDDKNDLEQIRQILSMIESISRKKRKSIAEVRIVWTMRQQVEKVFQSFADSAKVLAVKAGTNGIVQAINSGLLELHKFKNPTSTDAMLHEVIDVAAQTIDSSTTYPLLDEQIGNLIGAMIREGKLTPSQAGSIRGKSVKLASELFNRLPLFEDAQIDEIISIRNELERPLVRFRAGLIKMSSAVATAPWDSDFPQEVELLLRSEVEPAILDIEETVKSRKYLQTLLTSFTDKPIAPTAGSILSLSLAKAVELPNLLSASLGIAAGIGMSTYAAYSEWKDERIQAEKNQFYFYYRLREALT